MPFEVSSCIISSLRDSGHALCRCVGIGRRGGLKIHCQRWRAGSSPATGTTSEQALYRLLRFFAKIGAHSRRCSSFPNRTRCAGLRFGSGCCPGNGRIYSGALFGFRRPKDGRTLRYLTCSAEMNSACAAGQKAGVSWHSSFLEGFPYDFSVIIPVSA